MRYTASFLIFCLMLGLGVPGAALARRSLVVNAESGRPFLIFDIHDIGEVYGSEKMDGEAWPDYISAWTLGAGEIAALKNASGYWSALWGNAARNSAPALITVGTFESIGAFGGSLVAENGYTELVNALLSDVQPNEGTAAVVYLGRDKPGESDYLGPLAALPANGNQSYFASFISHELGHAMGILPDIIFSDETESGDLRFFYSDRLSRWDSHLVDSFGARAEAGMEVCQGTEKGLCSNGNRGNVFVIDDTDYNPIESDTWGGYAYFQGPETMKVLGGDGIHLGHTIPGIPVSGFEWNEDGEDVYHFPDLAHIELRNSMMSHQYYRNWTTFMEAELAVLQDIGIPVDRKNFFGQSLYTNGGNPDFTLGFYARNADGTDYLRGVYNTAPLSVGLHLYGTDNKVTVNGESLSIGYGGVGIRVDGWENELSINQGTRIHALGEGGAGLMVAYGKGHTITHRGEIVAAGPGGVGARFDFGDNIAGNGSEYRGSYIRTTIDKDGEIQDGGLEEPKLGGPLVKNFDVSGALAGSAAAIYISGNAYVKNIDIRPGAQLFGDIISHWNPAHPWIQHDKPGDLTTALNFGPGPGDDFFLDYRGNITGADSLKVSLEGGTLAYGGDMDVLSFTAENGSKLLVVPSAEGVLIKADDINLAGTTGLFTGGFSYGAPLAALQSILRFEGGVSGAMMPEELPNGGFSSGFYDYTSTSLDWDGQNLVLGSSRKISRERAGEAAITAPTAIALQSPYVDFLRDRARVHFIGYPSTYSTLWAAPAYGYSRRSGSDHYTLNAPGVVLGADRAVDEQHLIGAGAYFSAPAYRSDNADIDAKSATAFVYGSMFSDYLWGLDAFAALGRTFYDQRRTVHGERYNADYAGTNFNAGLSLNKILLTPGGAVIPFGSYTFTRLNVDGYNEGHAGLFGLRVGKSSSKLHRVEAGSSFIYALDNGFAEGRVFYSGLYGDREPRVDISMINDPTGYTLNSQGWAHDKHSFGLGLNVNLEMGKNSRFSGGYTFVGGPKVKSHQAEATFSINF